LIAIDSLVEASAQNLATASCSVLLRVLKSIHPLSVLLLVLLVSKCRLLSVAATISLVLVPPLVPSLVPSLVLLLLLLLFLVPAELLAELLAALLAELVAVLLVLLVVVPAEVEAVDDLRAAAAAAANAKGLIVLFAGDLPFALPALPALPVVVVDLTPSVARNMNSTVSDGRIHAGLYHKKVEESTQVYTFPRCAANMMVGLAAEEVTCSLKTKHVNCT
jgi:hypothetical protein